MKGLTTDRRDVLLAAFAAAAAIADVLLNTAVRPAPAALATGLAAAAALAWRRRFPVPVAAVAAAALAANSLLGVPLEESLAPLIAIVVAAYSAGAHAPLPAAASGLALMLAGNAVAVSAQDKGIGNFVFGLFWILLSWAVGRGARARTAEARALEARARQAAADERARIARELHDVISHSVSVMVVQAGAAEEVMHRRPDQALAAVQIVQSTGRQALAELARLLGVMREGGDELGHAPMPGVTDLDDLIAVTRSSGVPVELEVRGRRRALPAGLELSLYRIVQEALTNARKHAGAVPTRVVLDYQEEAVVAEVVDDGSGAAAGIRGGGHGLVGMRERAALYGGTLQAEPLDGGGFRVRARLPLEQAA